jgi:hypothetical protein
MLHCNALLRYGDIILYLFSHEAWPSLGNTTAIHNRRLGAAFSRSLRLSFYGGTGRFCPVHCSVVTCYRLSKENEGFEKRCKVNLTTLLSSDLYCVTRVEPRSRHEYNRPTPHSPPSYIAFVWLVFNYASRENKHTIVHSTPYLGYAGCEKKKAVKINHIITRTKQQMLPNFLCETLMNSITNTNGYICLTQLHCRRTRLLVSKTKLPVCVRMTAYTTYDIHSQIYTQKGRGFTLSLLHRVYFRRKALPARRIYGP